MFTLRDNLFEDAANGLIDFDHPAYGNLRQTMNGYIRFAHRLSVWHILYLFLLTRGHGSTELQKRDNSWSKVTRSLSEPQVKKLDRYRTNMDVVVFWHFLKLFPECILVWLVLLSMSGFIVIFLASLWIKKRSAKVVIKTVKAWVKTGVIKGNEGLNALALANGS